ncbi:MAG: hypothetical protein E6Y56_01725 [Negativicoccus succinicivorans]|nr:hypothetical protein [Negativicoccus succinicivorans]MDU4558296.1 hypothetical protein [Negativicoccus succinicivorans]
MRKQVFVHGHQCQQRLKDQQNQRAVNRHALFGKAAEYFRKHAILRAAFKYLRERKLPAKERTHAGNNHHRHNDFSNGAAKQHGESQTERRIGMQQIKIRHNARHHIG